MKQINQLLIKKRENVGLNHFNYSEAFSKYLNDKKSKKHYIKTL